MPVWLINLLWNTRASSSRWKREVTLQTHKSSSSPADLEAMNQISPLFPDSIMASGLVGDEGVDIEAEFILKVHYAIPIGVYVG
jgi:hypothetical protein